MIREIERVNENIDILAKEIGENRDLDIYDAVKKNMERDRDFLWNLYKRGSVAIGEIPRKSDFMFWLDCYAQEVREKAYYNYRIKF